MASGVTEPRVGIDLLIWNGNRLSSQYLYLCTQTHGILSIEQRYFLQWTVMNTKSYDCLRYRQYECLVLGPKYNICTSTSKAQRHQGRDARKNVATGWQAKGLWNALLRMIHLLLSQTHSLCSCLYWAYIRLGLSTFNHVLGHCL